jgi:hypothetical protein
MSVVKPKRSVKQVIKPKAGNRWSGPNWTHKLVTGAELVLINVVAWFGQFGWARDHLPTWHLPGQVMFALAIEGAAIVVAYHAYLAELADDASLKLRVASVGFGFLAGFLNYTHWSHDGRPTAIAVATALLSISSPLLWGMYAKRVSRNALAVNGLIEAHALRLGSTRWLWHPYRSFMVMRDATWLGQTQPAEAIRTWETRIAEAHAAGDDMEALDDEVIRALESGRD